MTHRFDIDRHGGKPPVETHPPPEASLVEPKWDWDRLSRACARSPLPWIYKGALTAEDARAAINAGASAIYVSNFGGRQLDCVPASLDQLPEVVEATDGTVPVLFDGGVRRATDVVKALALGADAVRLARMMAMGLAADGEGGVLRALQLLQAELVTTIALLGRDTIAKLDRSVLQPAKSSHSISLSIREIVGHRGP